MIKYQMLLSECIKVTNREENLKPLTSKGNFFFPEAKKETCCGSTDVGTNVL